ncbi:MAG: hypothetical protein NT049_18010, partial [Planctomycetota bacterium]|nr:hypothetical protein [Planctomycetota bacterium]
LGTKDAQDDLDLAAQLLEAARAPNTPPAMIVLICEKAYELAITGARDFNAAVQSLDVLADLLPARKEDCLARIITLRQRQYDANKGGEARNVAAEALADALERSAQFKAEAEDFDGAAAVYRHALAVSPTTESKDAVKDKIALMIFRQKTARQLEDLKAKVAASPADKPARGEMLRLYLVALNNPAEAAKCLTDTDDETTRRLLTEAVAPLLETPGPACLELGDWYLGLSVGAPGFSKTAMLARSAAYYSRFLELYTADDELKTRAAAGLKKVEATLYAGWTDLLPLARIPLPPEKSQWERQGDAIIIRGLHSFRDNLEFPVNVEGSYKLRIDVLHNSTGLWVRFPVGVSQGEWWLGGKDNSCTLSVGRKERARDDSLTVETGRRYVAEISVAIRGDQIRVTVTVEGGRPMQWQAPVASLAPMQNLRPETPRFSVGGINPEMDIKSLRLLLTSSSKLLPTVKPPKPQQPGKQAPKKKIY